MRQPKSMRWLITLWLFLLPAGCAVNPVTHESDFVLMSEEQELVLGEKAAAEVARQMPLLPEDDPLVHYVDAVGQRLAAVSDRPNLFYRFHVVDDKDINAFALPGGYIYVHRGLLTHLNSEAELAAVLGHEIGHVTARHAVKRYTQAQTYRLGMAITSLFVPIPRAAGQLSDLIALAVIQGYGRKAELQADELSIKYLQRAGYDPYATIAILKTLKRLDDIDAMEKKQAGEKVRKYHGAFASHPETEKRIREAVATAARSSTGHGLVNHDRMLLALKGYPYADSPDQGAVVGHEFLHPKLGIRLRFPDTWVVRNSPAALTARLPQQPVFFQLTLKELRRRQSASEVLRRLFSGRSIEPVRTGRRDGFSFAHALVRMSAPKVRDAAVDAWVFLKGPKAFVMLMWAPWRSFELHRPDFRQIASSFSAYQPTTGRDVPRIALHVWHQGDSWQRLARKSRYILGRLTARKLAALNGMGPAESPAAGTLVKIVR